MTINRIRRRDITVLYMEPITVTYQGKKYAITRAAAVISDILFELKINPETVLIGKNGTIVPETSLVKAGDTLDIVRTISGG